MTFPSLPLETEKAARAVFGRSNFYLITGDQVDHLFNGLILKDPSGLFPKSSLTIARLYLVTIFQFLETLPDHLAADALRERVDWKYALHLPMKFPGLDTSSFCEFRRWLLADQESLHNLTLLLQRLSEAMDIAGKQPPRLESEQVVSMVCQFSRLARIWETFSQAMEALASIRPDWLIAASLPHWYQCYGNRGEDINLRANEIELHTLAHKIGTDGIYLLEAISKSGDPQLAQLDEILVLRAVWREQFEQLGENLSWRKVACAGCSSPAQRSLASRGIG